MSTAETEKSPRSGEVVLRFDAVSAQPSAPGKEVSEGFDLALQAGELAVFEIPAEHALPDIAGLCAGLIHPRSGQVSFCGTQWRELDRIDRVKQRQTIGQVFQSSHRAHWLSNLDIDENVYLAEQMSGKVSQADLVARADQLCRAFDLEKIPGRRESQVSRDHLMRSQWVRAFLPDPLHLLILERPTFGVAGNAVPLLREKITQARDQGTAVLWIGTHFDHSARDPLEPTHHFPSIPPSLIPPAAC